MGVFEQLVPLIRFGQLLGVVPYSIETDSLVRKCKRVTFSCRHPVVWWCILVLILQILGPFLQLIIYPSSDVQDDLKKYKLSSSIILMIVFIFHFNIIAMVFVARAITFRYSKWRSATHFLNNQTVRALEELEKLPNCQNTIKRRTLIGISFLLSLVNIILQFVFLFKKSFVL